MLSKLNTEKKDDTSIFLKVEDDSDLEKVIRFNINKADQIRKEIKILDETPVTHRLNLTTVNNDSFGEFVFEKETDEEYLYYYSNMLEDIKNVQNDEERQQIVLDNLPSVDNKNYINIVNRIKLELLKEIYELDLLKQDEDDVEFIREIENEKFHIQKLLDYIKLAVVSKIDSISDTVSCNKNNLIFFQTTTGSVYAENDLYSISSEYYESYKELLLSIENGTFKNVRHFGSNNPILQGFSEVRDFKTRVVFRRVNNDSYVIIDIFVKKSDNDKGYLQALETRVDNYRKNKNIIFEQLADDDYLIKQREIRDNLIKGLDKKNIIKTMKRG